MRILPRRRTCSDFSSLCIRFVTEDDSLVQQYYIPYGSDFPTDQLPPVPHHEAQYGSWEDVDLTNMTFDATIHAEYNSMNTVRQSQEKRSGRSIVLVEGSFDTTDELMLHEIDDAPQTFGTLVEAWGLELPPTRATPCATCRPRQPTTPCCGSRPMQAGSRLKRVWTAAT